LSLQNHMSTKRTPTKPKEAKSQTSSNSLEQAQYSNYGRVREILTELGDSAWSHDLRTNTTWYSSENNPFVGYIPKALTADESASIWVESMHPDDRYMIEDSKEAYRKGKQLRHSFEYRIFDPSGNMHWVLDRGVAVEKSADGRPLLIVGTHVDVTNVRLLHDKFELLLQHKSKEIVRAVIERTEVDRKEIATVLHENVNQILTAGRMMLEFLPVMDKAVGEFTEKIKEIIYSAVDEVNKICNDINPDSLILIPLTDLVTDLVNRLNKGKKVAISFDHHEYLPSITKSKEHELTILRVIQECLHIIVHTSAATAATIQLESNNDFILLEVFCDDKKLDIKKLSANLRINNMVNRCELFGGAFHLEKMKNEGVLFKASIPV